MKEPTVALYLRIPLWLHQAIEGAADERGESITRYCYDLLTQHHPKEPQVGRDGPKVSTPDHELV